MMPIKNDQGIIISAVYSLQKHCNLLFHYCYLESERSQTIIHCQFSFSKFFSLLHHSEDMVLLRRKAPYNSQHNLQSILWHLTGNTCVVFPSNIAQYRIQRIKKSLRQHVNTPVTVRQRANCAILCSFILSTLSITFIPSLLDYCILPVIQNLPYQRREELKISCLKKRPIKTDCNGH